MSISASGEGLTSSEDEGAVGLPPSCVVATATLDPELTAMLGARPQSVRRREHPPASSRAAPPQAESTPRPAQRASRRRAEMLEFALSQETAKATPLLPPEESREENPMFLFVSVPPLVSKKEQFPFPPGS